MVIKFARLGKTSFKAVKSKRDYLEGRASAGNWLNMSRLAARREWDFLNAVHADGCVPTPQPIDSNRHAAKEPAHTHLVAVSKEDTSARLGAVAPATNILSLF